MLKIRILKWCKALSSVFVVLSGPSGRTEDKQMVGHSSQSATTSARAAAK